MAKAIMQGQSARGKKGVRRKVTQLDYDNPNEVIEVYDTIQDAANDNWLTVECLRTTLKQKNGVFTKRKLRFKYTDDDQNKKEPEV